jgi:hypothetical protein
MVRVLLSRIRLKSEAETRTASIREVLFVEKRKEQPHGGTCSGTQKLVVF